MAPKPSDDDLFIEPAEDEDVVYGDYNNTMDGASSSTRPYIRLTSQLRNVTRDSGAEVRMKCEAVGTLPISFTWLKNHAPIEKSRKVKVKHRESSSRLVLSDLEVLDSGYYQCIASNAAASVNSTSILRVNNVSGDKALKHRHKNKPQPAFNEDYEEDYEMDRGRLPDEEDADMYRVPDNAGGPGYAPAGASERWLDGVKIRVGDCVAYKGEACRSHLAGRHIMITSDNREDMYDIDRNLRAAMMFINSSPSISKECRSISQAVACYHMYKVCDSKQSNRIVSVCKRDCDRIEAEVCPSELALAAEHDLVGDGPRALLPKCASLPPQAASCIPVLETHASPQVTPGPSIPSAASHWCYVDSGQHYEGPVSITRTGKQCMQWSETTSREYNSDRYPQLRYAKNHCRNPGGKKTKPWCFSSPLGQEEYCDVPQCPTDLNMYPHLTEAPKINGGSGSGNESPMASLSSLWWSLAPSYQLALVCGGVGLSLLLLLLLCCACCCRGKKQQKGQRNHHHAPTSVGVHSANASVINSASNSAYYRKLNGTSTPILSRASGPGGHLEMAALLPNGMNNLGAPPPLYNDFRAAGIPIEPPFHIMEIPAQQLKQCELIGEGQFGVIHSGLWSANMSGDPLQVAIKTVRVDASNAERASLEEEVKTVAAFDHPNVVSLLGVSYLDGGRMAAVFDYQVHGDLVDFVRLRAPHGQMPDASAVAADGDDFMRIATQIACGMEYLSSQRFTHRDLAARNCLVGDQRVIQIAHFGLTRPGYDHHYYKMLHRAWMPVRWMSKEAIEQGRFGEASDVWAFGVTLWELWSYGRTPYEGMSNQQVIQLIGSRNLLECPTACPTNIYSLMVECWHEHPERRPSFAELHSRLQAWQMASPAHSMLQQRAASSSGSSGRQQRQTTLPRGRRLEDASPLMRRDANYAYSEDGDSD